MIETPDFSTRLSGGASNSNGSAALGGVKSSNVMDAAVDQFFDAKGAAEALAGRVEYRCVYLHNSHPTKTMTAARVWIRTNTPLAGTTIDIGVGTAAVNATEQTIANETAAPSGVTFSAPSTNTAGLALGNIPAGQHKAFWVRLTVTAGSGSSLNDTFTWDYDCETA
jgi:hypothetical protein